jgi:S-adenosylmethionine hydrolase
MSEQKMIEQLESEGFDKIWVYDAEPNEVEEEHQHDYDTKLAILKGEIQIISEMGGVITNIKYSKGQTVEIPRDKLHSAKVGHEGCQYIVAEKC